MLMFLFLPFICILIYRIFTILLPPTRMIDYTSEREKKNTKLSRRASIFPPPFPLLVSFLKPSSTMLMQAGQINYALLNVKGINKNGPPPSPSFTPRPKWEYFSKPLVLKARRNHPGKIQLKETYAQHPDCK